MNATEVIDVAFPLHRKPPNQWEREHAAFVDMLPVLLAAHRGKYVAVHHGAVVSVSDDPVTATMEAYQKHGYVPIHVGLVTDQSPRPIRIPSPRLLTNMRRA